MAKGSLRNGGWARGSRSAPSRRPRHRRRARALQRLAQLGLAKRFGSANPFAFMELQDVQELSNFFERTVSAYQVGVEGDVAFDEDF